MKRQRSAKKLQLSSETLLRLDQFPLVQGGALAGTLTFEGTCENSLAPFARSCVPAATRSSAERLRRGSGTTVELPLTIVKPPLTTVELAVTGVDLSLTIVEAAVTRHHRGPRRRRESEPP